MRDILRLLRPEQWTKNLFIFLPLFFRGEILNIDLLFQSIIAFFAFSAAASSIYCFNDIYDAEADRLHPKKCERPIASKRVSVKTGYIAVFLCFFISMAILFFFPLNQQGTLAALIGFYFVMNIGYCVKFKQFPIIDVVLISFGFVLRIIVGATATGTILSEWIVIMTFLLALFLAFAKRRDDVVIYNETGVSLRRNTESYNIYFLNQVVTMISTIVIVAYIMYTLSPVVIEQFQTRYVYITSVFVVTGIIRYLQVTIVDARSGDPTKILLKDRFIQACLLGWIIVFSLIIYI